MGNDTGDPSAVIAEQIIKLFHDRGDAAYGGEEVSQTEHAFQAATAAEASGADCELVAAALLHDIGHLLHTLPEDSAQAGIDDFHEDLGDRFLRRHFGLRVTEPVRLHVAAKRYLCASEPGYQAQLSPASLTSLAIQGGPFSPAEVVQFEAGEFAQEAARLRVWDDLAKVAGLSTQDWTHFREPLLAALKLAEDEFPEDGSAAQKRS